MWILGGLFLKNPTILYTIGDNKEKKGIFSGSSFTSFKQGEIPLTFILVAVFYIGQQVLEGVFVRDNISNLSHIVGGIIGGLLGYGFNLKAEK